MKAIAPELKHFKRWYRRHGPRLEKKHAGLYLIFHPSSNSYVVGKDYQEAIKEALVGIACVGYKIPRAAKPKG